MFDEETIRAERLLRIEATVRHLPFQLEWKARHGFFHPQLVAALHTDRPDRTGEKRLIGLMGMLLVDRLSSHRRKTPDFLEARRRQLPPGVAVDAGRIDKEVAGYIGIESFVLIGHRKSFTR